MTKEILQVSKSLHTQHHSLDQFRVLLPGAAAQRFEIQKYFSQRRWEVNEKAQNIIIPDIWAWGQLIHTMRQYLNFVSINDEIRRRLPPRGIQ